ncbi:MAG: hypothetical protein JWM32_644 [Verrucomicrobia bacterium]|nr:hypothetical protein [Verrucomicrobiota bacterium]
MKISNSLSRLRYTFHSARLKRGHSFGNAQVYLTLDRNSDVIHEPQTARLGLRDAWDQEYYLYGWRTDALTPGGAPFASVETSFSPASQSTMLRHGDRSIEKKFILPFENNLLRSAHYLFTANDANPEAPAGLSSSLVLPAGAVATAAVQDGHKYLAIRYANNVAGLVWGTGDLASVETRVVEADRVECTLRFAWPAGAECGLSFAYAHTSPAPLSSVYESFAADAPGAQSHLRRIKVIEEETEIAIARHLDTCRLWTSDPVVTDGVNWAKVNQLKDWQEYRRGPGFSNCPPSDVFVGRDTFWFLVSTNYYAQDWSRRLLEFWFRDGLEPNGKFIEYMRASSVPLFRDDYGLNINDNTPLLLIAAHDYFAISGDRGFLDSVYSALLRSANYILDQRNDAGLIWCRSRDAFVRGLCGWRNCTGKYQLSGAVTEINAECYRALLLTAELCAIVGDRVNAKRLQTAAVNLHAAINRELRAATDANPHYLLMIDPDQRRIDDVTGDLLFPALFGVAPRGLARAMLEKLFRAPFWRSDENGAGGMHTISPDQKGFQPRADPATYGLQGGVWPNLALWAARAASDAGLPDLIVQALKGTRLLGDRPDFDHFNVTPGEFPEYYNGDDLIQRGHPRSTFIHGSYMWAAWEGLMGLTPRASGLEVNPVLPTGWKWTALSRISYRGAPLTLLAVAKGRTLYTTARVRTKWKQVAVSAERQDEFRLESDAPVFWLVVGRDVLVASDVNAEVKLIERASGKVAALATVAAGEIVRAKLWAKPARRSRSAAK